MSGPAWMESAVCAGCDPELWFPEKGGRADKAVKICRSCPVRLECLDFSLQIKARHGIWGGLNGDERQGMMSFLELEDEL